MIEKKVLQKINENKIGIKDIFTRSKHWEKPEKEIIDENGKPTRKKELNEDYRNLVFYSNWKWWQIDYKFLPVPDKFIEIKKDFLENTWNTLENIPHYIFRNRNNELTIIFQNRKQLDFSDPRIVLFYGRNTLSEDTKKRNQKASRGGEEFPSLYWITEWDYINTRTLLCQLTAVKDPIWSNYGDMMNSKGTAYITNSQINNEHTEHPNDADNQSASSCPACDNCYDFCPDLRNKRANPPGRSTPQIAKWQPDFNLLYTENSNRTIGNLTIATDTGEGVIIVPNNLHLAKFTGNIIGEVLASDKPVLLFLVDKEHEETPVGRPRREVFEEELPECYNENPHLLNHSAAHFFFQKKLTTGGNLRHLDVRRRNGKLVLVYEIITRSSVAGILYQFRSGEIFGRWELKVRGSNQNTSSLNDMIDGFFGSCGKKFSEGINLPNQSGSGLAAISGFFRLVKAAVMGWVKKQVGSSINEVITGPKMEELMGVKEGKEKGKDKPENEQQVERKTKSTGKNAVEKIVEPSIFYSNTVDFSYDFWEFANRCVANPFMIRFEHSETLYNNLINNNDKSPIQNIQCRFSAFKQAVKVGYWQGKVDLFFDIDNTLSSACKNGTFFYDDLEKLFQPWRPKYKTLQSFTHGDTFNTGVAQGQEDVEVTTQTSTTTEELLNADMTNADYGIEDYIGSQDANIWQQMGHRVHAENWGAGGRDCLGCLCEGGSHDNPNYSFKKEYNFTSGGTLTLKTRGSGEQTCEIPDGGGKVVFEAKGNGGSITLETTTTTEHKKYHFKHERIEAEREKDYEAKEYDEPEWTDDNTASGSNIGETDPEQAEKLKEFDQEHEQKDWEDKETNLKENSGEAEKDFEKELEKQKEQEAEREKQKQLERELEREKEKEREKERELEKEKLREREAQAEREKKLRDQQWEREKKDRERLEREARTREREKARKEAREKQKQRDKERKERE